LSFGIEESDEMSNSSNPESDRMKSGRTESGRMSNSANPESDEWNLEEYQILQIRNMIEWNLIERSLVDSPIHQL
jgi:hypothetical protein